jgi:hypothetical protein
MMMQSPRHQQCGGYIMVIRRRRFKQTKALGQRLDDEARQLREEARDMAPCVRREEVIRKARRLEHALQMNDFLTLPELRSPR